MANIALGKLRDYWKAVHDWVTGLSASEPKVQVSQPLPAGTNEIGKVQLSGSITATKVFDATVSAGATGISPMQSLADLSAWDVLVECGEAHDVFAYPSYSETPVLDGTAVTIASGADATVGNRPRYHVNSVARHAPYSKIGVRNNGPSDTTVRIWLIKVPFGGGN